MRFKICNMFSGTAGTISLLLLLLIYSCNNQNHPEEKSTDQVISGSLDAVGKKEDRENVQNLVSLANCKSPKGAYTTEIHTASGGYSYFKQVYSYSSIPFEAVVYDKTQGFQIKDTGRTALNKEAVSIIRGHEFHNIILEIDKRFHDFEKTITIESDSLYKIKVKDELDNECLLFFSLKTKLLAALHFQNPDDKKEIIKIKFDAWRMIQGLKLPFYVEIDQSGKMYTFNYTSVSINNSGFVRK